MFIKELDTSDNKREKESSMLGLTFKSIFQRKYILAKDQLKGNN